MLAKAVYHPILLKLLRVGGRPFEVFDYDLLHFALDLHEVIIAPHELRDVGALDPAVKVVVR